MDNGNIREDILTLDQSITTQVNRDIGSRANALESTMASRSRDFDRMNTPIFLGSKV